MMSGEAGDVAVTWQSVRAGRWLICWRWRKVLIAMHVGECGVWVADCLSIDGFLLLFEVDGVFGGCCFCLLAEDLGS